MDRRIKYTKKIIKDTFINLLSNKEINKITVSEICKIADINRATFYRYYLDVYDLLDNIGKDFLEELKTVTIEENYTVASFSREFLKVLLENKELIKILFNTNNNLSFLDDFLEVVFDKCQKRWIKEVPNISNEEIEYASIFMFNGALGVINFWLKNDFDKSVDEIANIIEKLSYYGTRNYIYKKREA